MTTKINLELAEESEDSSVSKLSEKLKGVTNAAAQVFIGPLSLELMVDPVMAEDIHHHERKWIEKAIKAQGE